MIIGNFKYDWKRSAYIGEIRTLTVHLPEVQIVEVNKSSECDPDFRVILQCAGGPVELGQASRKSATADGKIFAVTLCDPALASPIQAELVCTADGEIGELWWSAP